MNKLVVVLLVALFAIALAEKAPTTSKKEELKNKVQKGLTRLAKTFNLGGEKIGRFFARVCSSYYPYSL